MRIAAGLVALLAPVALASEARADDLPSPWHLDVDIAFGRVESGFVSAPLPDAVCPEGSCRPAGLTAPGLRLTAGAGHAGLSIEASIAASMHETAASDATAGVGLRVDTGWDAVLSVFFRLGYVQRLGDIEGRGGRAGIGLSVRPVMGLALYGEASAEATSVPRSMNEVGTFVAWTTFLGGGARLSFGH